MKIAAIFACAWLMPAVAIAADLGSITYTINPLGKASYRDLGTSELNGKNVKVMQVHVKVMLWEDLETLYYDPRTLLLYKIERDVNRLLGKEHIIEDYDQEKFLVYIRLYKKGRLVKTDHIKMPGPIHNAIMLPLYLSRNPAPDPALTWEFTARLKKKFTVSRAGTDSITVPAGTFRARHFKSTPRKFDIWITEAAPQFPVQIKGSGIVDYEFITSAYSMDKGHN